MPRRAGRARGPHGADGLSPIGPDGPAAPAAGPGPERPAPPAAPTRPTRLAAGLTWLRLLAGVGAAGLIALAVDVGTLWLLAVVLDVPTRPATAVAFTTAGALNFWLNRRVFVRGGGGNLRTQGVRFFALFCLNLAITTAVVPWLATVVPLVSDGVALLAAKLCVVGALILVNTVVYRRWVFREEP